MDELPPQPPTRADRMSLSPNAKRDTDPQEGGPRKGTWFQSVETLGRIQRKGTPGRRQGWSRWDLNRAQANGTRAHGAIRISPKRETRDRTPKREPWERDVIADPTQREECRSPESSQSSELTMSVRFKRSPFNPTQLICKKI